MNIKLRSLLLSVIFLFGCSGFYEVVPRPKTEIIDTPPVVFTTEPMSVEAATNTEMTATPTITPTPTVTPTPAPTSTPVPFLADLSTNTNSPEALPYHGIYLVFMVFGCIMLPWALAQTWYIRFAQPKSFDVTEVLIKAKDGLFVTAVLSMTSRRSFTATALFTRWGVISEIVSKTLEQSLLDEAMKHTTLDDLLSNIDEIATKFIEEEVVQELWTDFGIRVMRFNIETRYPQATIDALNRKAEANAGGQAYLEYARAAHLDPGSPESRELYRVYQETRGQIDAARNLGGGITNLANILGQKGPKSSSETGNNE